VTVPARAVALAIAVHALWGGNPVAVKFGLLVFPPMWSAFVRFAIGIACIVLWARLQRIAVWPERGQWLPLGLLSALFTVQIAALNFGLDLTSAATGSVLVSTNPLFAAVCAHFLITGDRLTPRKALGLAVAFLGAALILGRGPGFEGFHAGQLGDWLVLASAALLGLRLVLSSSVMQRIDPVRVNVWLMCLALPFFAAGGLAFETVRWDNLGWGPVLGLAYQGVVIAGLGFLVLSHLLKHYPPSTVVAFNFVAPVAGVLLAVALLSEPLSAALAAGTALVALGLYVRR
jgi:drug/metabolite transporter (DMT)-like permease